MRVLVGVLFVLVGSLVLSTLAGRLGSEREEPSRAPANRLVRIQVWNGSGESGIGARVASYLREGGFQVVEVENADRPDYFATMVVARRDDAAPARAVARYLGGPPVIRQAWSSDLADVTVVIGSDRSRLHLD